MSILRDYPDAIIAFRVRLGDRYRHLQDWLDTAPDGHRYGDMIFFNTLEGAQAFVDAYGERILNTALRSSDDGKPVRTVEVNDTDETIRLFAEDALRRYERWSA